VVGVGVGVVRVDVGVVVVLYALKYFELLKNYLLMCFAGDGVGGVVGIRFPPVIPV
jgi:hypothetical protein